MKRILLGLLAGLVSGGGLVLSGMTQPAKVTGFLDLAGAWDPSLAFVMGGAIPVYALAVLLGRRLRAPLVDGTFREPPLRTIDPKLVGGAALFGVGWGLGGYCPGPGLVSLGSGSVAALVFVIGLGAGIALVQRLTRSATALDQAPASGEATPAA